MIAIIVGCKSEKNPAPGSSCEEEFTVTISNVTPATCDSEDGSFEWSTTPSKSISSITVGGQSVTVSTTITGLSTGIYEVVFKAEDGCETTTNVNIQSESGLTASLDEAVASDCNVDNGAVMVSADGGTPPYDYLLDGNSSSDGTFDGLAPGEYAISITDASGCTATVNFVIDASISFATDVEPLIQNNCAVSGCHVEGTGRTVFANYDDISANSNNIRQRVSTGVMPPQNSGYDLTQQQRDDIVCWIDAGANNN
ncbi:hypothetical protein [Marinigracilibium pacificum]|nr:hypothetical protein [Marinigracilibium pacificum]